MELQEQLTTNVNLFDYHGQLRTLNDIEREVICHAIKTTGSIVGAARALGIGRSTVYRKVVEFKDTESSDQSFQQQED